MADYFVEERLKDHYRMQYDIEKILFEKQSEFQNVSIVQTKSFGKMLLNDSLVMITERDEFIYHDMISHVPLFTHPHPQKVLIIGGGDGGTLREVLRHKSVEKAVMVEIDEVVVEACREFIPQTSLAMKDPRAEVLIEDGVKFAKETTEKFDVVIVDSTDPIGPATPLFGAEFYQSLYRILSAEGIVVAQAESPHYDKEMQLSLLKSTKELFSRRYFYNYSNLTYPGSYWSFLLASKGLCPIKDFHQERVQASALEFDYYSADIHRASFVMPAFMRRNYKDLVDNP